MCLVYDAGTGKFVPQDLATYVENTPSFENKIREVAGTAELVVEDGSAVVAKVNVYQDSTYLPLVGNNAGDQAFATDNNKLYIWDGSAWQLAGAANTGELPEGTNLYYTDARVGSYLSSNGYDTATNIVASITDSAPATLDTLNELAAALGDDPNFATTTANNIAGKVAKTGDTMTGALIVNAGDGGLDVRVGTDKRILFAGNIGEIGSVAGFQAVNTAGNANTAFGIRATDIRFATGSDERVRITDTGVGIGTGSPSTTNSGYDGGTLHVHNTGTGSSIRLTNSTTGTGTSNGMLISKWSDSKTYFTNFDNGADMVFTPTDSGGNLVANTFVIKGDGKIGIGTANPVYQLHVNSGATNVVADFESTDGIAGIRLRDNSGNVELSASGNDFRVQPAGGTAEFVVKNGGNVGIGTDTPEQNLHIKRASGSDTGGQGHIIFDVADDGGPAYALRIGDTADDGDFHIDRRFSGTWYPSLSIDRATGDVKVINNASTGNTKLIVHNNSASNAAAVLLRGERTSTSTDVGQVIFDNSGKTIANIRGATDGATTNGSLEFFTAETSSNATRRWIITSGGDFIPSNNDTYDIGSTSAVVRNIYTGDLHLSNENKTEGNSVDGTKGNWTIQEGEEDLFIINNKTGKKYAFALREIE
jgi:hypothetical protein